MAVYEKHDAAMVQSGEARMSLDPQNLPESAVGVDYSSLEVRVLALTVATGESVAARQALQAMGSSAELASDSMRRLAAAMTAADAADRLRKVTLRLVDDQETLVRIASSLHRGVLTSEELQAAFPDIDLNGKRISVEYHAPQAPGRKKVGGAQWKSERRGGFSRR